MKVPYAKKWQKEADKLRKIALDCDPTEELKWSKPCFTFQRKNVAIVIPLKESCALAFFKGALLKDPKAHPSRGRRTHAGGAVDQIYLGQRSDVFAVKPDGLHLRGRRDRGVREEGRTQETFRVPSSRGIAGQAE